MLEEALDGLPPDGSALRARLLVRLAVALYYSEQAQRREDLVQEALGIARGLDDPPTLAYVLDQGHIATNGPDTAERGLAWAQELFALADAAGDPELSVRARSWQIDLLLELDDLAGADMAIEALDRIATDSRDPRARAYIPLHRARRAMIAGHLDDTEVLIHEGIQLGWSLQDSTVPILAGAQLFWLRMGQGRLREIEDAVRQFADQLPAMPAWRVALAMLYMHTGRPAEARREYDRLAERDFATIPRDNVWSISIAMLAELSETFRDAERSIVLEELLAPLDGRNVVTPTGIFAGPVRRYLALTAAARGDQDAALARLAEARVACERMGYKPMLAVLDVDEARMLARRNRPGDVEQRARAAAARAPARRGGRRAAPRRAPGPRRRDAARARRDAAPPPPSPPGGRRAPCSRARATCGAWTTRAACCACATPRACATSRCCWPTPASSSTPSTSPPRPRAAPRRLPRTSKGWGCAPAPATRGRRSTRRPRPSTARAWRTCGPRSRRPSRSTTPSARRARARRWTFIAHELSAAVGLGGRDRRAASAAERARVNVTRALRREIRRIADEDAGLGRELETTVRTGTFCAYEPDPRRPVAWEVDAG